ncbi:hypothetical protein [Chitinimonas sp. BJB300]|uniref:hypothetical protein n=1 Tax=Chitinimonas sp. BJB300 TaxID=1559339 RepID=UPI0011821CB0|nr:hypothetical protein [Chitinimonas sp. BJB300]
MPPSFFVPPWVWALLVPIGVFVGLFAYEQYTVYRFEKALAKTAKEVELAGHRAVVESNQIRFAEIEAQQERNYQEAKRQEALLVEQRRLQIAHSVTGCATDAKRTKCSCFDASARTVPAITTEQCMMAVDKGMRWFQYYYANESS